MTPSRAQKSTAVRKDWIHTIENDKKEFNIKLNDEDLMKIKKEAFRKMIKKEAVNATLR